MLRPKRSHYFIFGLLPLKNNTILFYHLCYYYFGKTILLLVK